ncbi:MAG: YifB family Mg chelatase-like AAA ATPase [Proteobacteria bacterium]|nr:YifB family Mg chelatase-like AAA ATPase [Pseudomonadota bacterium]
MLLATVLSRAQIGMQAPLVQVEVSLDSGLPVFIMVGLPATVVRESKERVRAALLNSGFDFPAGRITVSLQPAEFPKEGGRFDLPIAMGILLASGQVQPPPMRPDEQPRPCEFYGELALSGELRPAHGLLLAAIHAKGQGHELLVPQANAAEVARTGCAVRAAGHLLEVCRHVSGQVPLAPFAAPAATAPTIRDLPDLADVRGQFLGRRALIVAAAGGHSLLFIGPPGSGKSMLAMRLPGLLPPLRESEALEVASIASVSTCGGSASATSADGFCHRPFRTPHHSASAVALIGGGPRARPGEVSLAHHGVLFLDELPEFPRAALEALREPLETGEVLVSRAALQARYPAAFQLVAAMNPCPCGRLGDLVVPCCCTRLQVQLYRSRISGPLLDRLDLQVQMPRLTAQELAATPEVSQSTESAARCVAAARKRQLLRQDLCNARLSDAGVRRWCVLDKNASGLLHEAIEERGLSGRSRQRVLRVARTIADLAGARDIAKAHVAEALGLRCLDRPAEPRDTVPTAPSAPCDPQPA